MRVWLSFCWSSPVLSVFLKNSSSRLLVLCKSWGSSGSGKWLWWSKLQIVVLGFSSSYPVFPFSLNRYEWILHVAWIVSGQHHAGNVHNICSLSWVLILILLYTIYYFYHYYYTCYCYNQLLLLLKKGWQCKAGRERLTPYQSEDPTSQQQPI